MAVTLYVEPLYMRILWLGEDTRLRSHSQGLNSGLLVCLSAPLDPKHHEGRSPAVFFTLVWPAHSTGPGPKLMLKKCWLNSWRSVFPKPVCILIHHFVSLSKHDPTNHWNILQLLKIPQLIHSLKNPHSASTQYNNTQSLKMVFMAAENEAADEGRS